MLDLNDLLPEAQLRLAPRGWTVRAASELLAGLELETSLRARHSSWPPQMEILVAPEAVGDHPRYGLVIDFRSMPFTGERFKDIFNHDREELLSGFGSFQVRQRKADGAWSPPVSGSAFIGGFGASTGIAKGTALCIIERSAPETGEALVERFLREFPRLDETCSEIASALQRVYQRTVLASTAAIGAIYSEDDAFGGGGGSAGAPARPAIAPASDPVYPWRR